MKYLPFLFFSFIVLNSYSQYSFTGIANSNVSIQPVVAMHIIPTNYTVNYNTIDQIVNGITLNLNTIQIKSNIPWKFNIAATSPFFSNTGVGSNSNMPSSIVKLGVQNQTGTINLSTATQTLKNGNRGSFTSSGNSFTITLNANPGFEYGPGIYIISVNYTLTAQ